MPEFPRPIEEYYSPLESETPRDTKLKSDNERRFGRNRFRFRIFDQGLPENTIAHLNVELDVRRIRPKDEVGGGQVEGDFASQLRERVQCERVIRRIERDYTRKAKSWTSGESDLQDESFDSEAVLRGLCDPSITDADRRELVIQAEQLVFDEKQKLELLPALMSFADTFRDSRDLDELIAVGSAIRKYTANIGLAGLGSVATLLEAGHAGTPSLDVKLEIVKMVFRKFEANPPSKPDPESALAERIYEIAEAYLDPNVLPDGRNAAVAMLAVQSLFSMLSKRAPKAITTVNRLPQAHQWFRDQLRRRMIKVRDRWPADSKATRQLSKLIENVDKS